MRFNSLVLVAAVCAALALAGCGGTGGTDGGSGGGSAAGGSAGGGSAGGGSTGGGSAGGSTGGGSTGGGSVGGGSTGGGGAGGGSGGGEVIDPLDDGGTFVPGDICGRAIAVNLTGGTPAADGGTVVSLTADLSTAGDQYFTACGASEGNDLIYKLELSEAKAVTIKATGADVALELEANPCPVLGALVCADDSAGATEELTVNRLNAGTYYLMVDANNDLGNGVNHVSVNLEIGLGAPAAPPPSNDTCSMATSITPGASTTVNLSNAGTDMSLFCAPYGAFGDAIFSFTLSQTKRVSVTATPGIDDDIAISIINGSCDPSGENTDDCSDFDVEGAEEIIENLDLPAGTHYLVVRAVTPATAPVGIALTAVDPPPPPANDTCATATVVSFTNKMFTATNVDVSNANDDAVPAGPSGQCDADSGAGGDVYYQVTVPAGSTLTVTVTPTQSSFADPVVYIRSPACAMVSELVCANDNFEGDAEQVAVTNSSGAPVTYFVVVDDYYPGDTGPETVSMVLTP